ncbi:MAG: hypothetical protein SGJ07_08065 [Rhodospirillaceae bacterium]|nr:hypothetical protein [Rhodospirillaceae bacterium]
MSLEKTVRWLGREIREILPPTIFFFIAFALLLVTQSLVLKEHGIDVWDWGRAIVGALIVGKVVLIVDKFHFIDRYPDRPLIWNALWKTLIYNIAATAVHYLEKLLPLIFDGKGLAAANRTLFAATDWEHIVLIHMWLAVLLLAYCCARELVRAVGPDKVRHMFFHARGN